MFVLFFRKGVTAGGIHFFVLLISYFQEDQFSQLLLFFVKRESEGISVVGLHTQTQIGRKGWVPILGLNILSHM